MTQPRIASLAEVPVGQALGQVLGQAQSVLTRLLGGVVAETGTTRETYLALLRLSASGGTVGRQAYIHDLSDRFDLDLWAAGELADDMAAAGLLTLSGGTVTLADAGAELRARIGDGIGALTAPMYGRLDPADLDTTIRTLAEITELARETLVAEGRHGMRGVRGVRS